MDFKILYIFEEEIIPSRALKKGIIVLIVGKLRNYDGTMFSSHLGWILRISILKNQDMLVPPK